MYCFVCHKAIDPRYIQDTRQCPKCGQVAHNSCADYQYYGYRNYDSGICKPCQGIQHDKDEKKYNRKYKPLIAWASIFGFGGFFVAAFAAIFQLTPIVIVGGICVFVGICLWIVASQIPFP
jgi:hypothetical protein